MANPNFIPATSTNEIYRDLNEERCLTDDLDTIESDIEALEESVADLGTDKAAAVHTHAQGDVTGLETALAGKAATNHTHTPASIGAAAADHSHNYAAPSHTHEQSDVTGLATALAGKAAASHTHQQSEVSGLTDALAGKANASALTGKADLVDGKVPASQLPSFVDDVIEGTLVNSTTFNDASGSAVTPESGKIYVANNKTYRWSGSAYVEISQGVTLGETSATAYRGDRGKTAYDHSQNGTVHVTAAQKTAWDSKAAGDHTHNYAAPSHTHAQSDITGLATALAGKAASNHGHSFNDLSDKPTIPTIPSSLPANGGNADTVDGKHASDFATAGHTHTGFAASNHTHSGFAASNHTHTAAALLAMAGALFGTNDIGGVEYSYGSGAISNLLTTMAAWPQGLHTAYVIAGTNGAPPVAGESWRIIAHKTSATIGWFLAFGSSGSIYANYQNSDTTFRGWRAIFDYGNAPLWSGGRYMTQDHTVTPTKKLSECRTGWMLLWSDYDPDTGTVNNTDFCTTFIPKRNGTGGTWNGSAYYCDIPRYTAGTATDSESRVIKVLNVYDAKLVGTVNNAAAPRNDVVLRAVYEF